MVPEPHVAVGPTTQSQPPAPVCRYVATVGTSVITSSLDIMQPLSSSLRAALVRAPGYVPWPPPQLVAGTDVSSLTDVQLLLFRLKALFDFAAGIEDDTAAAALTQAIDAEWPSLADARGNVAAGLAKVTYEYAKVSADVDGSGEMSWGFQRNVNAGTALPIPAMAPNQNRPEYDRVLQNLVRLDLLRRIEATL